jgi:hypothetical protein
MKEQKECYIMDLYQNKDLFCKFKCQAIKEAGIYDLWESDVCRLCQIDNFMRYLEENEENKYVKNN